MGRVRAESESLGLSVAEYVYLIVVASLSTPDKIGVRLRGDIPTIKQFYSAHGWKELNKKTHPLRSVEGVFNVSLAYRIVVKALQLDDSGEDEPSIDEGTSKVRCEDSDASL